MIQYSGVTVPAGYRLVPEDQWFALQDVAAAARLLVEMQADNQDNQPLVDAVTRLGHTRVIGRHLPKGSSSDELLEDYLDAQEE